MNKKFLTLNIVSSQFFFLCNLEVQKAWSLGYKLFDKIVINKFTLYLKQKFYFNPRFILLMKKYIFVTLTTIFALQISCLISNPQKIFINEKKIITSTKRIHIPSYPGAYNPSIIKFEDKYLLTFRYLPNRFFYPWLSYVGVVLLNESFELASPTQLIDTRFKNKKIGSQSEDARLFSFKGKTYIIYNDNTELIAPSNWDRRDMYLAELLYADNQFIIADPIKLYHENKYANVMWQKNWSPFEWNGTLLFSYSINPHEIIQPDLGTGYSQTAYETEKTICWNFGTLRGGSPAILIDDEYLAFFHSALFTNSASSDGIEMWHYFMGAYSFSPEPPFHLTKVSQVPLDTPGFYTYSSYNKRVIYPGGFVVEGNNLYLVYGKDDSEIWIATIDINELKKSMIPVNINSPK